MYADIKGSLDYMKKKPIPFEHRGVSLLQNQAKKVLEYGLKKGYKTTAEISDNEIDEVLGWGIKNITDKADNAKDLQTLIDLWNEVANNKYSYSLGQIRVANKHIRELALKVEGSDLEKGKFYHALNEMVLFEVGS